MITGPARQLPGLGTVDAENPWPGLAAFREADQPFFQGRTTVIEELARMVLRARLTVLHGVSGLGKTSVLRAGLFPRVRPEYLLPIYVRLSHAEESAPLVDQVREAIAAAASAAAVEAPSAAADRTLWEYFHRKDAHFWDARNRIVTPLLVVDQFEELFTIGRATAERRSRTDAFLTELSDLVEGRPSPRVRARLEQDPEEALGFSMTDQPCKVLISLREDFLPDLADLRSRMPTITDTMYRLQPMTAAEALSVVEVGGSDLVDRHVAEQIVQWVASDTGDKSDGRSAVVEPALLSVFCRELNNKRQAQGGKAITADLLETKREAIISDFYERTIQEGGLSPAVRVFVEERLLTESGFRDSVAEEQALRTPGVSQRDVETLITRRLLRREDGGTKGRSRIEITHDVLAEAVRTSRDRRRLREREEQALAERRVVEERTRREADEAANRERQRRDVEAARALAETQSKAAELAKALALEEQRGRQAAERLTQVERRVRKRQIAWLSAIVLATAGLAWVARQSAERTREELSVADVDRVIAGEPLTLAYLARAVKNDPDSEMARALLLGHLSQQVMQVSEMTHDGAVTSALLNATGTRILTVSDPGTIRIWEAPTGTPVGTALVHDEDLIASAFSVDGRRILTATRNGVVRVWDAATAAPIGEPLQHNARVNMAAFDQAGERVVTASDDHQVRVWNPTTGEQIVFRAADDEISSASFEPGGTDVLSISQSGEAAVWEPKIGTTAPRVRLAGPGSPTGVALVWFSRDGQRIIAMLRDGSVRLIDARSGRAAGSELREEDPILQAWFDPISERLVTTSNNPRGDGRFIATLWDTRTGARLPATPSHRGAITMVAFSRDGTRMVTASVDRTAQVWDTASGVSVGRLLRHDGPVVWAGFSTDGARVVTASKDQTAQIWDAASGAQIGAPLRHDGPVLSAVFSSDGVSVLTASSDKTARVWDARTGTAIGRRLHPGERLTIKLATFSPDGAYIATVESLDPNLAGKEPTRPGEDGSAARIWDAASGQAIGPPLTHAAAVNAVEFSSAGPQRVVTASDDGTARLWNTGTGSPIGAVMRHDASVWSAAFSPDGTLVVTASADNTARIWDARTGQPAIAPLMHPAIVRSAAFSPDGSFLVTGCDDKRVRIWNARTGAVIATSDPHLQSVTGVRFSRTGDRILSSSSEDSMIWDAKTHHTVGHVNHPTALGTPVLSPDGKKLVVTEANDAASVWDVRGEPEWRGYLGDDPVAAVAFTGDDLVATFSVEGTAQFFNLRTLKRVGLTMPSPSPVWWAAASVPGSRLLSLGVDGIVWVWDVPAGSRADWQPLVDMASVLGGHEVESANAPDHIKDQTNKRTALRDLARNGPAGAATAAAFRRWLFADPATRTISPLSRITVPEYVTRLLAEGESGRVEAARLFPGYRGLHPGDAAPGPDAGRAPAR